MGIGTILKRIFRGKPSPSLDVSQWFTVEWNDDIVELDVRPPGSNPWTAQFRWSDIECVCLMVEDYICSDGLYIFTSLRPESWVVPTEAKGGRDFLYELIRRELFDAELAARAATATGGLFCWPPFYCS
ncbi:MAG: hypothetical protein ACLQPD_03905 [Desulfomonilaceae bacterium]